MSRTHSTTLALVVVVVVVDGVVPVAVHNSNNILHFD